MTACSSSENDAEPEPDSINSITLSTKSVVITGLRSASSGGNITDDGGQEIVLRGICWSKSSNPTINDKKTSNGSGVGVFNSEITGLDFNSDYFFRAYATSSIDSTYYGDQKEFSTTITSALHSDSTSQTAVWMSGIISEELEPITQFSGICWDTNPNPVIAAGKNYPLESGDFNINLTSLIPNSKYYFRTFMIIPGDTLYSIEVNNHTLPEVSIEEPEAIAPSYAIMESIYNPSENGPEVLSSQGICISKEPKPTLNDIVVISADPSLGFHDIIRALDPNTTYYARAYATNDGGTGYSEEIYFSTEIARGFTFTLNTAENPSSDQLEAYIRITKSAIEAIRYYDNYTSFKKHVWMNYVPGVPTADANIEGWMRFGSNRSYMNVRTMLHELAHTIGIGTSSGFNNIMVNNVWSGSIGTAKVRELSGNQNAVINRYGVHIGPYGLNFDSEGTAPQDFINHCKLMEAMRQDGM